MAHGQCKKWGVELFGILDVHSALAPDLDESASFQPSCVSREHFVLGYKFSPNVIIDQM